VIFRVAGLGRVVSQTCEIDFDIEVICYGPLGALDGFQKTQAAVQESSFLPTPLPTLVVSLY
jgi:hypothetical protein